MSRVLLAIDTSFGTAVAVLVDGKIASESHDENSMQHAEQIGVQIRKALEVAKIKSGDVTAVAVGIGPGPFTGLRVGIAAAKMFAEGISAPIYGIGSLEAIAFAQALDSPTVVLSDARRSEVYYALFHEKSKSGVPKVLLGPGVKKLEELEAELRQLGHNYTTCTAQVRASSIGFLALAGIADGSANNSVVANYLRAPDAVPAKGKKVSG